MRSVTTPQFRKMFAALPEHVQRQARAAHGRFLEEPNHPGLNFKRVNPAESWYSVRVGRNYRAVGVWRDDEIRWFWIGTHVDYDKLLAN